VTVRFLNLSDTVYFVIITVIFIC